MALKKTSVAPSGDQTGATLIDPTTGTRWVLKRLFIKLSANGTVTIFDGTDAAANHVYKAAVLATLAPIQVEFTEGEYDPGRGQGAGLPRGYAVDSILKYTTTGGGDPVIVAHYFEE